jgi:hypothetical protein
MPITLILKAKIDAIAEMIGDGAQVSLRITRFGQSPLPTRWAATAANFPRPDNRDAVVIVAEAWHDDDPEVALDALAAKVRAALTPALETVEG